MCFSFSSPILASSPPSSSGIPTFPFPPLYAPYSSNGLPHALVKGQVCCESRYIKLTELKLNRIAGYGMIRPARLSGTRLLAAVEMRAMSSCNERTPHYSFKVLRSGDRATSPG